MPDTVGQPSSRQETVARYCGTLSTERDAACKMADLYRYLEGFSHEYRFDPLSYGEFRDQNKECKIVKVREEWKI